MINTFFSVPVLHCHKLTEQRVERSLTVRHVTRLVGVPTIAVLSFDFCAHSHTWICRMRERKNRNVSALKLLVYYRLTFMSPIPTKRILGT